MASKSCILLLSIFLVLFVSSSSAAYPTMNKKQYKPCKRLVFYYHDILYNGHNMENNATSAIIGAPQGRNMTALAKDPTERFGSLIVFDGPLTLDDDLHSEPVARAQGMYLYDEKQTFSAWFGFTVVLNSTEYGHGNINIVGANSGILFHPNRDLSIVGGTGDFFMHRGIVTFSTREIQERNYFRLKFDLKFYECW